MRRRTTSILVAAACLVASGEAGAKKLALQAAAGGCVRDANDVYPRVATLLAARGHTVTIVADDEIDTLTKLSAFDAIAFGAGDTTRCPVQWDALDTYLKPYLLAGGGVVVTGFGASTMQANGYAGVAGATPVRLGGGGPVRGGLTTVVPGHSITAGLASFVNPSFEDLGLGTGATATVLLKSGESAAGAAVVRTKGRAVYLAPNYLSEWSGFDNEALLDGTIPDAQELFLRAVEWAAFARDVGVITGTTKALDLGSAPVGGSIDGTLVIENRGDGPLVITSILATTNSPEFRPRVVPVPFTIPAGGTANVTVTFQPASPGARVGALTVASDDRDAPSFVVALGGTAAAMPPTSSASSSGAAPPGVIDDDSGYAKAAANADDTGGCRMAPPFARATAEGFSSALVGLALAFAARRRRKGD